MQSGILRLLVAFIVVLVAMTVAVRGAADTALPDIDTLLEGVARATKERDRLLENSRGNGLFQFQRGLPPCEWRKSDKRDFLPLDEDGILWTTPSTSSFSWVQQGTQHRLDQSSFRRAWTENRATEPDTKMLFVDASDGKGYIDKPPHEYANLINFPRRFDIDRIYHPRNLDPTITIPILLKKGYEFEMRRTVVDGIPCIHVAFEAERYDGKGGSWGRWLDYYFAPAMNFALLKAMDVTRSPLQDEVRTFRIQNMSASYYPDITHPDVWMLRTIELSQKTRYSSFNHLTMERFSIVFDRTEIDADIPAITFTLSGLGLPDDAPVYDLRIAGIRVEDTPTGLQVHPESAALFRPLPQPVALSRAFELSRDLLRKLPSEDQPYLYDTAKNKTDIPTIYSELYRTLALSRLNCPTEDFRSLLEYGLAGQDEVFVRVLFRPYLPLGGHPFGPEWARIAIDVVDECLATRPEDITPLHVETLVRAINVSHSTTFRFDSDASTDYERAIQLTASCLMHENIRVQAAVIRLLPVRHVRTVESLRCMTNALQGYLATGDQSDGVSGGLVREAREKLTALHAVEVSP